MTNPNDSVIMLNGMTGKTMGSAIILKVMADDMVSIGIKCYYATQTGPTTNPSIMDALSSLANGVVSLTGGTKGTLTELNAISSPLYVALNTFINTKYTSNSNKPCAYLNWIFLNDQFVTNSSTALYVGNTTAGVINTLGQSNIVAMENSP